MTGVMSITSFAVPKTEVTIVNFPDPMAMAKSGDGLVLKCDARAGYQIAYLQWIRRRDNFTYSPIYEDPLCNAEITNVSYIHIYRFTIALS